MVDEKLDAQKKKKLEELIASLGGAQSAAPSAAAPKAPLAAATMSALDSGALKTRDTNAPPPRAAASVKGAPKVAASAKSLGGAGKVRAEADFSALLSPPLPRRCPLQAVLSRCDSAGCQEGRRCRGRASRIELQARSRSATHTFTITSLSEGAAGRSVVLLHHTALTLLA